MRKTNRSEKNTTIFWLLLIYVSSVLVRYLLALATRNYPTVSIDEFLYYSLGRSIATEGSLLYLGQPAIYNYIVYPLIISPVYLLFGHGTNYFRIIELWNIILMSLSVFPFFGLCNAMVRRRKTALWLTGLFMLLPCFILGEFIYSEAIIYPLLFSLMYCVYRYLRDNRIRYTIWIGILGALLYYSKPGAAIPAVLALAFFAVTALRQKSGKAGIQVLAGAGCLAVSFFALKLVAEQVLGYRGALLSVYDDQVVASKDYNIEYFFSTAGKYPYYFIIAGGVLPFIVSLWRLSEYDRNDKQYYLFLIICSLLTMIGTAWIVNRPERKEILYLRYVEMYLPVLLAYCFIPGGEEHEIRSPHKATEILCFIILGYITACTAIWGSTTGTGNFTDSHFLISLSALFITNVMGIANILIVAISGITLYLLVRKTEKQTIMKTCCALLIVLAILNSIQGYITTGYNTDQKLADETEEIHRRIGDQEYIHVYAEDQCDFGLDVNSRRNIFQITERDFRNNIIQNEGVYVPFVPSSARGMNAVLETPDVETIIVDEKIYPYIQFSANTSSFVSADNSFRVVHFVRSERLVDSIMNQMNSQTYSLRVYNKGWLYTPVKIRVEMESQKAQDLVISAGNSYTVQLSEGRFWYDFNIQNPVDEYIFTAQNNQITIYNYEIQAAD